MNITKLKYMFGAKKLFLSFALFSGLLGPSSYGIITVSIFESGSDLVFSTDGGTLDLTDLTTSGSYGGWGAGMDPDPDVGVWAGGTTGATNNGNHWNGSVSVDDTNWNLSLTFNEADTVSVLGMFFGFGPNYVSVPSSFTQSVNTVTASTIRFSNMNLAGIGLSQGESITASWGSGNPDRITVTAVPEAGTIAVWFGVAALFGCMVTRRRRG